MRNIMVVFSFLCLAAVVSLSGCQTYKTRVVPFKPPSAYANVTEVADTNLAAKIYADKEEAEAAFGFDIVGAEVLPVQVVFDNKGRQAVEIIPDQTYLIDEANQLWPILGESVTYQRIAKKTEMGRIASGSAKGTFFAGTAGAIIGAAIGIVSGINVGNAALQGLAIGSAAGIVGGAAVGAADGDVQENILRDLQRRSLEKRPVFPGEIVYGFLFFPGETTSAKVLRLRVRETDSGKEHTILLGF